VHPDQPGQTQKDRRKQQRRAEDRHRAGDLHTRPHAR
jgi:hypothetical protein